MKAAICRHGKILVDEVQDPVPGPGQVLTKTLACGICGSDLHALEHGQQMADVQKRAGGALVFDVNKDLVFGHEFVAEVLEHGAGAKKTLSPGTRVCSIPMLLSGSTALSVGYSNDTFGGFAERMLLSEDLLLKVSNGLSTDLAALTEPLAVGLHAVEKARWDGGEVPIVVGCGAVGLAVIAGLKQKGVGPIIAADFSPARRALAETMGADIVVNPAQNSPYKAWQDTAIPEGFDPNGLEAMLGVTKLPGAVIFECVGVPGIIQQMFAGAPKGAQIIVAGVCMQPDSIEPLFGISKELSLQFAYAYTPVEFANSLHLIAQGLIDVEPLVTGKVGIDGVAQAFEDLADPEKHSKILVEPWR